MAKISHDEHQSHPEWVQEKLEKIKDCLDDLKEYLSGEEPDSKEEGDEDDEPSFTENPCWEGYEMVGTKEQDGKQVPNCVKKDSSDHGEMSVPEGWVVGPKITKSQHLGGNQDSTDSVL